MIVGKYSALKGFGLLVYVVISLMTLIGCCLSKEAVFIVVSILNLGLNGFVAYKLFKYWSK